MKPRTLTSLGSLCRQNATKSLNGFEKFPSSVGGEFFGIRNNTFIGCSSAYGGSPFANSIAVIPRLQISALWSYPDCLMTSGDIQYGVPTKVFFFAESVPESCPDTPKSASLTSPVADRRMFAAVAVKSACLLPKFK